MPKLASIERTDAVDEQLAPDEVLSPELVLVLPPELRARAIARLGPPRWPSPAPRVAVRDVGRTPLCVTTRSQGPETQPRTENERWPSRRLQARLLGELLLARLVPLAVIFATVTAVTLVMSVIANAMRP